MTTPANDVAASASQRLATWLGSDTAEAAVGLAALPAELATHVGECLSCYRFAASWRELPKRETELRALLVDSELETETFPWNDAFWRQLPARVFREVNADTLNGQASRSAEPLPRERAPGTAAEHDAAGSREGSSHGETDLRTDATLVPPRTTRASRRGLVARGASLLLSGAAAAALVFVAWSRDAPSPKTSSRTSTMAAPGPRDEGESLAPHEPGGSSSAEEASWVGALADLEPRELASLLRESDEIISVRASTLWQEVQELEDLQDTWGPRAESWDDAFQGGETSQ